jgi:pantetheine-phosphate adenylyltransferase
MKRKVAIYPGSFDPFTNGHINIIERGVRVFEKVIVAVAHNASKKTTFTIEERVEIIREVFLNRSEVKVDYFQGLLVEYARKMGSNILLRGMRTVSDFEYELQMALSNKTLYPEIETIFMVTEGAYSHISSSLIKEIIALGGSAKEMIPEIVEKKLKEKLLRKQEV